LLGNTWVTHQWPLLYYHSTIFGLAEDIIHDWVIGDNKQLILYIPAQHQIGLYPPWQNPSVGTGATKLDIYSTIGGDDWQLCHTQSSRELGHPQSSRELIINYPALKLWRLKGAQRDKI
jgi:hypothetical protein